MARRASYRCGVPDSTWRLPSLLLALQTLVLAVLAVALLVTGVTGHTDNGARAATEGLTVVALAVCSGLLTAGFWKQRSVARTPSLVWNAMAVIAGITLATSGAPAVGALVIAVGVLSFGASLRVPAYDLDDLDGDE